MAEKLFVGPKVRTLRESHGLTQSSFSDRLGISTSYLNQIENNQRPLTAPVLLALSHHFNLSLTDLATADTNRVLADLKEALADPLFRDTNPGLQELKMAASNSPWLTQAFLTLHQAHRRANERLMVLDDALTTQSTEGVERSTLPYEEVRDYFHYHDNYIDELDQAAEDLARRHAMMEGNRLSQFQDYLEQRHNVRVRYTENPANDQTMRHFDQESRVLSLNSAQDAASLSFLLAHQIAIMDYKDLIDARVAKAGFRSEAAEAIGRIGLANYFAGALCLPYQRFLEFARETRHDIERIRHHFGASPQQVAHRLSSMQRPGARGVPFYFLRVDKAGNVTKRHSATRFQFARFGGACPLWNVHEAFEEPGRFLVQIAEMPDGLRYLCIATSVTKLGSGYHAPVRRYAIGLGCEISYADEIVYSDGLNLKSSAGVVEIGVSCRICERRNCHQRAVPPVDRKLIVDPDRRQFVPFELANTGREK
ncbi:short-chain fatty acyl-CoA regulator family protein [Cohaesibacter celericrescens]|uniref:XRE family transcriptional regulator n=1 Tax=Cohaesibacter celericrescens TaxID=2067669 RepID=A0A2N5XR42_9HYPH|nr:short-chain fatty acyl-CoA regulator family protein [Cohaesibacter celericrescens]PLW76935.1 XRE family transcriptional regulator [Cohaesibacter celericrescens]